MKLLPIMMGLWAAAGALAAPSTPEGKGMSETVQIYSLAQRAVVTTNRVVKTDAEWRTSLTPEQYQIARHGGTECSFTGKLYGHHEEGTYTCVCCGADLFVSDTKFESGTGWPSFFQPVHKLNIRELADNTHGMRRVEVRCARCDAHLGHVFDDGPKPTGLRYCINSASLKFMPKAAAPAKP